jgi:hypothetical protein
MRIIEAKPSPRADIEREENVGDCFKRGTHYYLVRENDVLHVNTDCINSLFDNHMTDMRHNRDEKFTPIERSEFNQQLNEAIFRLNIFAKEFKENV